MVQPLRGAHGFKETGRYAPGVALGAAKLGLRLAAFPFIGERLFACAVAVTVLRENVGEEIGLKRVILACPDYGIHMFLHSTVLREK